MSDRPINNLRIIVEVLIDRQIGPQKCASSEGWHDQWEQVPPG
jgi:hypothetical protein